MKEEKCAEKKIGLRAEFSEIRKLVKRLIQKCLDDYVEDCEEKIKTNSKCFFAFTKSLRKTNLLPGSMKLNDDIGSDRQTICNLFARYFNSVFNPVVEISEDNALVYDAFLEQVDDLILPLSFAVDEVEKAIKGFDRNKVTSPDLIPMMFFYESFNVSKPVAIYLVY